MINLKEHAIFIDKLQMEMVPLSVAEKAVQQVLENTDVKLEQAMAMIESSLLQINKTIDPND